MGIREAIYTLVTTDAGVAALITKRFFPLMVKQDETLPAASYQVITASRNYDQTGPSGFASPRIQISVTGKNYDEAVAVANAVRSCLNGYRGTVGGVKIFGIFLENEYDGSSNLNTGKTTVRQDYRVNWSES